MAGGSDELAAAQRSYQLRASRLKRAESQLAEASQDLSLLFDMTFKYPDPARAKFSEMLKQRGLKYAAQKMCSSPADVVPKWKALRGEFQILNGPNREKEVALENLKQIPARYRKLEEAQTAKLLAERMLETADQNLRQLQNTMPVIEQKPKPSRQRRQLRQR